MKLLATSSLGAFAAVALMSGAMAETRLTIATVNNGDMIRMQKLTDDFTKMNPDIALNWVTLEENVLRQKVTTDIATKSGQYDISTIGTYEVPIWAKKGWLVPLDDLGADYDIDDLLPAIRSGLSLDGKLYAAPFYGESRCRRARHGTSSPTPLARSLSTPPRPTASACAVRLAGVRIWHSFRRQQTPLAHDGSMRNGGLSSISRNGRTP
jgi:hypothetical protein